MRSIALFILACTASSIGFAQQNVKARFCSFGADEKGTIEPNEMSAVFATEIFTHLTTPINDKQEKTVGVDPDINEVEKFQGLFSSKRRRTEIFTLANQSLWDKEKLTITTSLAGDLYQALDVTPNNGVKSVANLKCTQGRSCEITGLFCMDYEAPFPAPNAN